MATECYDYQTLINTPLPTSDIGIVISQQSLIRPSGQDNKTTIKKCFKLNQPLMKVLAADQIFFKYKTTDPISLNQTWRGPN